MSNPTWSDVMRFNLPKNPIIFDIGGYKGDWTQLVLEKYDSPIIYVFEPVKSFYDEIVERFNGNNNVKIYNFGLSDTDREIEISVEADSSSVFKVGENTEIIKLRGIREFLFEEEVFHVDLAKINIEGEEYRLMERLVSIPELNVIENYLIQFHKLVDDFEERHEFITRELSNYYDKLFDYEYIFEGWSEKKIQKANCLGDSHISIFSASDGLITENTCVIKDNFYSYRFGPYLAYNLQEKGNVISYGQNCSKEENLLVCFGEIDCRSQVKKICDDHEMDYKKVVDEIISRYFLAIDKFENKKIITFSVTPEIKEQPHWYYYKDNLQDFDCPRGTMEERSKFKEYYNGRVKEESEIRGYKFISIYEHIAYLKHDKDKFFLDDIHLKPRNVFYLIKREMIKNGLIISGE